MDLVQKIRIINDNEELIKKQIDEGNQKTISMARLYEMNKKFAERYSIDLFESSFEDWYEENKNNIERR